VPPGVDLDGHPARLDVDGFTTVEDYLSQDQLMRFREGLKPYLNPFAEKAELHWCAFLRCSPIEPTPSLALHQRPLLLIGPAPERRPRGSRLLFVRGQFRTGRAQKAVGSPVVLVVEDEALLRSITGEYLRLSGYVVIEATDAAEAIEVIGRGERPDVVFSDVSLSGTMDGLSLARWLRRQRPDLHVMLTSGHGKDLRRAAAQLVGGEFFLPKPYHQQELVHRIGALLGRDQASTD